MSKIGRLFVALQTGAFWQGFTCKPAEHEFTPIRREFEAESHKLWEKYRKLRNRYGDDDRRFTFLYDLHHRALVRLIRKYEKY